MTCENGWVAIKVMLVIALPSSTGWAKIAEDAMRVQVLAHTHIRTHTHARTHAHARTHTHTL